MSHSFISGDVPPNPLEKPGYRLEFHDAFRTPKLDEGKWLPYHLPQWSSRGRAKANYTLEDGVLKLQIREGQAPWCPEFDGEVRVASFQTGVFAGPLGSSHGQHRFQPQCRVREEQKELRLYTPQYGFFEARLKAVAAPENHVALWLIGYEDAPERSAEIAICEIMGEHVGGGRSRVGYGVHPWADPNIGDAFHEDFLDIDAAAFHLYAAEWTPTRIDFYLNNHKIRTVGQSPHYPMQLMLGIYERPWLRKAHSAYPKTLVVDYVRAYQPIAGYPTHH